MAEAGVLVVVEVRSVRNDEQFKRYQTGAREQISRWGGRVVARGGAPAPGEGVFAPLMVQAWPSEQAFIAWQDSEEYRPLRAMRRASADLRMAIVPLI